MTTNVLHLFKKKMTILATIIYTIMKYNCTFNIDIGNTLRKFRNINKLSQQYVSNHLDISRQAYLRWEKNNVDFSISQLKKIADLYKVPLHMIIMEAYTPHKLETSKV